MPLISFQCFFVQAFKTGVDSWKFNILLLYILWDDWLIFTISGSHEQLQQELQYTLLKPDFHQDNPPVHNSILVTDYLTKMGIKTVRHSPYSPDLASCYFWLFPKLRGCHYETIEEMKKSVTKVIDALIGKDFHGAFQRLLERYNKCIAAGGGY